MELTSLLIAAHPNCAIDWITKIWLLIWFDLMKHCTYTLYSRAIIEIDHHILACMCNVFLNWTWITSKKVSRFSLIHWWWQHITSLFYSQLQFSINISIIRMLWTYMHNKMWICFGVYRENKQKLIYKLFFNIFWRNIWDMFSLGIIT